MNALLRFARVFDNKDNPARVAPPLPDEVVAPRFVELNDQQQRRMIDLWLVTQRNSDDILSDLFSDMDWQRLMPHVVAGDDCEIGRQVVLKLKELGKAIDEDQRFWVEHER